MAVINTNVKSLIAADSLRASNTSLAQAMERLSTGKKINSAKDDAAGLAISSRMTAQVRGLNMAIKNANDGINLAQTAEGAMGEITSMLQRMRELAVQAGNGTNSDTDRAAMNDEVTQLKTEIDRISKTTQFNGMNILDGSFAGKLQIGNNASQTMNLAIGAVGTAAMGETTHGAATAASAATLAVTGGSTSPAAFQGASFNVAVNGVNQTVTLPLATAQTQNVAGANAQVSFAAVDATPDNSTKGQVGAFYERTYNLSVGAASTKKLEVKLNTGPVTTIDIGASSYYADATKASGAEIVNALQTELNKNAAFQGSNALKVAIDNGHLSIGLANGQTGTIALSLAAGTLLTTLGSAAVSTNSGAISIGAKTAVFTSKTAFDVGTNHFDLSTSIAAHGYDAAKLTGSQFVTAYNETAKVNGVNVSTASISSTGILSFSGNNPATPAVGSAFAANGDLTTALAIVANTQSDTTTFSDAATSSKVGQYATNITAGTNDTLTLAVNGGQSVSVTIPAKSGGYTTMSDLAAAVQNQINQNGSLTGASAVTVSAVQDSKNRWGLSFSNASGSNIDVSGNFMTAANTGSAISSGMLTTDTVEGTTTLAGYVTDDATAHKVTVHGPTYPPSVGSTVFTPRVVDLTATNSKFEVSLYGGAAIALDLSTAINKHVASDKWDITKLNGDQVVQALNETFAANGNFAGDNAVTASLSATGQIQLAIAKLNPPIGSSAPAIELADSVNFGAAGGVLETGVVGPQGGTFIGAIGALGGNAPVGTAADTSLKADATGVLSLAQYPTDKERFGITNLVISGTNSGLNITVPGSTGNPVNLTLDSGVYNDVNQLISNINKKITATGAFVGPNALTVSAVTDPSGNQGFTITSATGQQVKVGGTLISVAPGALDANGNIAGGFGITTSNSTVTFPAPASAVGGVDLSKGNDVTLSVADSAGKLVTKSFNLNNNGAHVSRSDYATALQTAANTAFAGTGVSFTANVTNGKLSFASNQVSSSSLSMTGAGVVAAFGSAVTGTATTVSVDANKFNSMKDVVAEVNKDLNGVATAAYDSVANQWSFTASGAGGTNSTIALSGAGLTGIQFGGNLSATGTAGDAVASKLSDINVLTTASATSSLSSIDNSIEYVSKQRSLLGAIANRLSYTVNNLTNIVTNTEASRSAIEDTDYSKETTALAKQQIITQAATAMLAQANQSSQSVLSLLK